MGMRNSGQNVSGMRVCLWGWGGGDTLKVASVGGLGFMGVLVMCDLQAPRGGIGGCVVFVIRAE